MKKVNKILIAIALMIVTFLVSNSVLAATISRTFTTYNNGNGRPTGFYGILSGTSNIAPIIKIVEVGGSVSSTSPTNSIYCFRAGTGFGSGTTATATTYTNSMSLLQARNSIPSEYRSAVPGTDTDASNYNSAVALLQIFADVDDTTSINNMLSTITNNKVQYSHFNDYASINQTGYQKDIIEAVQQAALWYFTNPTGNFHPIYDLDEGLEPTFKFSSTNSGYINLSNKSTGAHRYQYGTEYYYPAEYLFMKLVDYGLSKKNVVPSASSSSSASTFDKSNRTVVDLENGYSLVGPYTFTLSDTATLTSATINVTDFKMYKADKTTEYAGSTFKDKLAAANGQQFYLRVPNSVEATNLTINIGTTRTVKTINCLTVGANALNVNQPLVEIDSTPTLENFNDTVSIVKTRKFDLALRKYITKINSTEISNRVPDITSQEVANLYNNNGYFNSDKEPTTAKTTARKTHPKNALEVQKDDKVVYTIRIYNEGNIDGKCTQITDYLPEGLILTQNSSINTQYGWTASSDGRTVTTSYLSEQTINALTSTAIDSKYVQIECTVTAQPTTSRINLINVAEITGDSNEYNLEDRDSTPRNLRTTQINRYEPGTSTNGKGYEDDDDFEPLYLAPRNFDLALRKFITKVNGSNVAVSREPNITAADVAALKNEDDTKTLDNGTTSYKRHTKDPLLVETNDVVTYKIRVYNEGSVDGYATEVTDYLPEGLALKTNSSINDSNDWVADPSDSTGRTIRSNKLDNFLIQAFDGTNIRYQELEIECVVLANSGERVSHLKNVAEITQARNIYNIPQDRDSQPNNLTPEQKANYNPEHSRDGKGFEDDDDYEDLYLQPVHFDLALRKFITHVNGSEVKESREPVITQDDLRALATEDATKTFDNGTTSYKRHTKDPVEVSTGDSVIYTIRVYNEGSVDGYCTELVDYLPVGLKFKEDSELNDRYGWTANEQEIRTDFLKDTVIKALAEENGVYTISYVDVQIECTVEAKAGAKKQSLKNVAEITESRNDLGLGDIDSEEDNITNGQRDDYRAEHSRDGRGYQDDDDYEDLVLVRFDLALRKFITKVNDQEITSRIPVVDTSKFGTIVDGKEVTTCDYNHTKEPVLVGNTDVVVYTIRVYNEGNVDGYCESVKDDIPQGLTYLPDHEINKQYGWTLLDKDGNATTTVSDAKYVITDFLKDTLIRAFDKDTMDSPDYKDVKVAFKVDEPTLATPNSRELINHAQIRKSLPDIDSTPDEWIEGEDDQDIEKVKVLYFDLSLRKWVTHAIVIEDGVKKVMETGHKAEDDPESIVKVELNHDRLKNTVVKFQYSIRIKNEGEIEGYCTEISDYIPEGLKFVAEDNKGWKEVDGKVVTDQLKDKLLKPGETAEVTITLTWINNENNMGVKINTAEISKDKNKYNAPDIDSTPNNRKAGEDDIDDAPVALVVMTGAAQSIVLIGIAALAIVGTGIVLIKKYVI